MHHCPAFVKTFVFVLIMIWGDMKNMMSPSKKGWIKTVPYSRLVKEILLYTNDILYKNNITHFPRVKILYYKHKQRTGYYYNSEITIYIKSGETTIDEIVNVLCHEIFHFIDHQKDGNRFHKLNISYNLDDDESLMNYFFNGLERGARSFAAKHERKCLQYLQGKGLIYKMNTV